MTSQPTFRAPGVYVIEDQTLPMPLEGAPTGVPCFFGFTQHGPSLAPTRIASLNEFYAVFGPHVADRALFPHAYLVDSVHGFFLNGGGECYVCRVNGGDVAGWPVAWIEGVVDFRHYRAEATRGEVRLLGLHVEAVSGGTWANELVLRIAKSSDPTPHPPVLTSFRIDGVPEPGLVVTPDRLEATDLGGVPPDADRLKGAKLTVGEGASAVEGAWRAATDGAPAGFTFAADAPPPNESAPGVLALAGDDGQALSIPVRLLPDNVLPVAQLRYASGVRTPDPRRWDRRVQVDFERVTRADGEVVSLAGFWSAEHQAFFLTTAEGEPFALNAATVRDAEVAGVLRHPLELEDARTLLFDLEVLERAAPETPGGEPELLACERYPGLSTDPDSPRYFLRDGQVNGVSNRIVLREYDAGAPGTHVAFGAPLDSPNDSPSGANAAPDHVEVVASDAADAPRVPIPEANRGTDRRPSSAIYAEAFALLDEVPDVSLIACPDAFADGLSTAPDDYARIFDAAIRHAEENSRLAVIDAPPQEPAEAAGELTRRARDLKDFADRFRSTHAAIYAPWLVTANLDAKSDAPTVSIPPSGCILGVYNLTDNQVGVWKAPANVPLMGALTLTHPFTEDESELLNPEGVNLIRHFPGQGIRVWGARTTSVSPQWRYVNTRRLLLYVERTLRQQALWATFESNDERTWSRLVTAAESFLRAVWKQGGLMGSTPEEAFLVRCGVPSTMTAEDVENGLLKVEIAIAPVRPADFVAFTIRRPVQAPR